MSVKGIPEGFQTVTPHLSIDGAAKAIDFYKKAFAAEEISRAPDPSGKKIWHAHLKIGDSNVFVNDVFKEMDPNAKQSESSLWLCVADVDMWFKRAVDAGAKAASPPADMFWGDRVGHLVDPFGQTWTIATRVKELTPAEMKKAGDEMIAKMKSQKP